jgi:PPIC-type peptidyl-prolyl cis-trans isomerase-like protein
MKQTRRSHCQTRRLPFVPDRKRHASLLLGGSWLVLLIGSAACRPGSGATAEAVQPSAKEAVSRADASTSITAPAPGRWRLSDPAELSHVMLWVSHILIRHDESEPAGVSFSLADWVSEPAPVPRTRAAALALARHVMIEAELGAEPFAGLARRYSEDLTTRQRGGSLGGVTASMLLRWPQVLDALEATAPGQVSEIVETTYGFHIFLSSQPPPEERISGAHIVIGHEGAGWLRHVARSTPPVRSRVDALARARQVQQLALGDPGAFSQLVREYSDHRDAAQQGDLGEWSSLEPTPFPRELDVLRQLREGEVSEPLETLFGVQVLLRTPSIPRRPYAMAAIQITFDPALAETEPFSKQSQRAGAESLLSVLTREPERFEPARRQLNGSTGVERWTEGRGPFGLQPVVDRLGVGQIASELIELDKRWVIVKRLEPTTGAAPKVRFELPTPERSERAARDGAE